MNKISEVFAGIAFSVLLLVPFFIYLWGYGI